MMKRKKWLIVFCACCLLASLAGCGQKEVSEEWEAEQIARLTSIAATTFFDVDGGSFQLGEPEVSSKPIVICFWATRSPASTAGLEAFEKAYLQYGEEVLFLMVNAFDGEADTMEDAIQYIETKGYTFPVCYDRQGERKRWHISEFPYAIFMEEGLKPVHVRNTQLTAEEIGQLIEEIR